MVYVAKCTGKASTRIVLFLQRTTYSYMVTCVIKVVACCSINDMAGGELVSSSGAR